MSPQRIQRRRLPGWRLPAGAICVDRTSRWGNRYRLAKREDSPFPIGIAVVRAGADPDPVWGGFASRREALAFCVELHRRELVASIRYWDPAARAHFLGPLAGRDLACFCDPADPCHADTLIEFANQPGGAR